MKLADSVLNIVSPLLFGALIYVNNAWLSALPFARNYAADGLWSYAFASAILIVWDRRINYPWLAITLFTGILFEWLQYVQVVHGTADLYDLLAYITGLFMAIFLNKYFKHQFAT